MFKSPAFMDIAESFARYQMILFLAISELKSRYRRSTLGPFWLTLSTFIGAMGLGFLWSKLMRIDAIEFVPSLTAGLIIWGFVSGIVVESTTVFSRQGNVILNIKLPFSMHCAQLLLKHIINLAHTLPVFFLVAIWLGAPFNINTWLVIPSIVLVALNLLWISLLVGLVGTRFRDFEFLISSTMPILMFISPVFFRPNYVPYNQTIIWLNPFSYFIEIVRQPLLGFSPTGFIVLVNLTMLILGTIFSLWLFHRKYNRLSFWL